MVLEDSPIIALDMEIMLQAMGFERVCTAMTLDAAQGAIAEGNVDFAILDVRIGGETSAVVAEQLRLRNIPFVFATGYGEASSLPDGFQSYPVLTKPVTESDLDRAARDAGLR